MIGQDTAHNTALAAACMCPFVLPAPDSSGASRLLAPLEGSPGKGTTGTPPVSECMNRGQCHTQAHASRQGNEGWRGGAVKGGHAQSISLSPSYSLPTLLYDKGC